MSEQTITEIIPPVGAANETVLGDYASYFRWDEERRCYQMNRRIDPSVADDHWVDCPSPVYDLLANPNTRLTVGALVAMFNTVHMGLRREREERSDITERAHRAVGIIGQRLLDEADKRNWCDEFDTIIDEVNDELPSPFELPVRKKPRKRIRVRISSNVSTDADVWVDDDCDDEDDPDNWYSEQEDDSPLGYDWAAERLQEEINYNGFDDVECETF